MIVHPPRLEERRGAVRLVARVEREAGARHAVDVWFEVPARLAPHLTTRLDPFACALFLVAQRLGERLVLEGPVDEQLADGVAECMPLMAHWNPATYAPTGLVASERVRAPEIQGLPAATAFSGGVDSLYTLRRRLPGREDSVPPIVTRAVFVHGFDIPVTDHANYAKCLRVYGRELAPLGVEVVPIRTSIRLLRPRTPWDDVHNPCLAAVAHLLEGVWSLFLVPSSHTSETGFELNGSHPFLHLMLSGTSIQVRTDGLDHGWREKTRLVIGWEVAHRSLRVCYKENDGVMNCGRCNKCLRRMMQIKTLGGLDRFETFKAPLDRRLVRRARWASPMLPSRARWMMKEAWMDRNWEMLVDMGASEARRMAIDTARWPMDKARGVVKLFR
jgi:hypothetical protein